MPAKSEKQRKAACAARYGKNPKGASKEMKKSMTDKQLDDFCKKLTEGKTCTDLTGLADKEGVTHKDVDPKELEMGIEVEYEHTKDKETSKKIALDHLAEIPDYYTRLKRMQYLLDFCTIMEEKSKKGEEYTKYKYDNADACKDPKRSERLFNKSLKNWNKKAIPKPPTIKEEEEQTGPSFAFDVATDIGGAAGDLALAIGVPLGTISNGISAANHFRWAIKTPKTSDKIFNTFFGLMDAVAMLPAAGDVAGMAGKWGVKGLRKLSKMGKMGRGVAKKTVRVMRNPKVKSAIKSSAPKIKKLLKAEQRRLQKDGSKIDKAAKEADQNKEQMNEGILDAIKGVGQKISDWTGLTKAYKEAIDFLSKSWDKLVEYIMKFFDVPEENAVNMFVGEDEKKEVEEGHKLEYAVEEGHKLEYAEDKNTLLSLDQVIAQAQGQTIVAFDTETTGLDPNAKSTQITEIAAIAVDGTGKTVDQYHVKIDLNDEVKKIIDHEKKTGEPFIGNRKISDNLEMTGYDSLDANMVDERKGVVGFKDFVEKYNPLLLAQNLAFDMKQINTKLKSYGESPVTGFETIDTLTFAKTQMMGILSSMRDEAEANRILDQMTQELLVWDRYKNKKIPRKKVRHTLEVLGKVFNVSTKMWHSGIADTKQLIGIYFAMIEWMKEVKNHIDPDGYRKAMGKILSGQHKSLKTWMKKFRDKSAKEVRKSHKKFSQMAEEEDGWISALEIEDPEVKKKIFKVFENDVADGQRNMNKGGPEWWSTARSSPLTQYGTGMYQWLCEHVGDLTHRMAQKNSEVWGMGREWVAEKVNKVLNKEKYYSLEKEVREQIQSNVNYMNGKGKEYWDDQWTLPKDYSEWMGTLRKAGRGYAEAHSEIIVYNEAQYHARQAAVRLGLMDFNGLVEHLKILQDHLKSDEEWERYASQVKLDSDNNPIPLDKNDVNESCMYDKDPEDILTNKEEKSDSVFDTDPDDSELSDADPDIEDLNPDMTWEDYIGKLEEMISIEMTCNTRTGIPSPHKQHKMRDGMKRDKGGRVRKVGVMETIRRSNAAKNKVQKGSDKAKKARSASMRPTRKRRRKKK
jgi:DNA polymerase III epsilon subunit-like protein